MGMAASQARLLYITARQHDIELRAQQLLAAKVQLATQGDAAWEKYNAALDATTMTVNRIDFQTGKAQTIPATFDNLTGLGGLTSMSTNRYAMYHNDRLMLSPENFDGWEDYQDMVGDGSVPECAEAFAMVMMDLSPNTTKQQVLDAEKTVFENTLNKTLQEKGETIKNQLQSWYDQNEQDRVDKANAGKDPSDPTLEKFNTYTVKDYNDSSSVRLTEEQQQTYNELMEDFRLYLYNNGGDEIFNLLGLDKFDEEKFDYYTDLYYQIKDAEQNHMGLEEVDPTNLNNSEWLTSGVQQGEITIATWNEQSHKRSLFEGAEFTSPSTDSGLAYTQTQEIDSAAQKKAEAEYEHTLKQIDSKEKKIDNELAKLETERNALSTMYDSVKKVIEDNVERTFGIFS